MAKDELREILRPGIARDGRPAGATESPSRHIFVVRDGEYVCSRCGSPMTPGAVEETCPKARLDS